MDNKHLIIENLLKHQYYFSMNKLTLSDKYYLKAYKIFKKSYPNAGTEWFIVLGLEVMTTLKRFKEIEQ